jgi:hypothetical protein
MSATLVGMNGWPGVVECHLASADCACVVIGADVRLPPQSLAVFEAVVNEVHRPAPVRRQCHARRRKG